MNDEDRRGSDPGERDGGAASRPGEAERQRPVAGAYMDVGGEPAFVIAAIDREGAWLAVPRGTEIDAAEWH